MSAVVRPFRVVHRSEQLTPQLRALLTDAANSNPYVLSLGLTLLVGASSRAAEIAAYFTPTQQRLLKRQQREADRERRKQDREIDNEYAGQYAIVRVDEPDGKRGA